MLRERMFKKRIEYLKAQIDLAKHNMQQFEQRIKDQQDLITQIDEVQDGEKEALEVLQAKWDQMQKDQETKEEYWRSFWQSGLLHEAPFTRKNLLKRKCFGDRQHEGRYVLDEKEQEKLKQELSLKRARMEEIAADSYEEEITLRNLQEDFSHTFQFRTLTETLNNELARRERMNSGG
jgi:hypothetical protein